MLIYIFILSLLLIVLTSSLSSFLKPYRTIQSTQAIENSAETSLERITREIRSAKSVDLTQSTLGSSPGQLMLNTTDDSGTAMTIQFFMSGQSIRIKENGVDSGALTSASTRVTNLVFRQITTTNSQAVKIEMTIESGQGESYLSKKFYSTVVMRGSYQNQ